MCSILAAFQTLAYQCSRWCSASPTAGGCLTTPRATRGRWSGLLVASWYSRYELIFGFLCWNCFHCVFSVFEETSVRTQVPNDRVEAEGCHPSHQPGKGPHVQKEKNRLQVLNVLKNSCIFETHIIQGLWWSTEPQGGAGEDRESFPDLDFNLFMCKFFFLLLRWELS